MASNVNPDPPATRRYDSPRRKQQAAATRTAMLEAAQRLLERDGYASTTMAAIAGEAGVALKTVYLAFDTKSGVVRAVWDVLLRGPTDRSVADTPWYQEVLDEPDPHRALALNARNSRAVKERLGRLLIVIREAAAGDDDMASLWSLIESDFYLNQHSVVASLVDKGGGLRDGLDVERASDLLWTLNHPENWRLLVVVRGWSPADYEAWLVETSSSLLLGAPHEGRRGERA